LRLVSTPDLAVSYKTNEPTTPTQTPSGVSGLRVEHDDGSISISLDGKPIDDDDIRKDPLGWFDNLAEDLPDIELNRISDDLLRLVEDDLQSRQDWIEDRAQGIKLLGLKIEIPNVGGSTDGAPVEGMSRVRHPLLLEAVLRFQANARGEMLPTDGPVKVRDDGNASLIEQDKQANDLEKDLNHYLTVTASEYYPDTDRMLFMLGFGGSAFKKVYFCPLRNRPVSESVDADDLIVNYSATDLRNARRITHRSMMKPSTVKRLQIMGVYRDVDLSQAELRKLDAAKEEKDSQQGITATSSRMEDRDREVYEIYCEQDLLGYEHKINGKETGLELPYRITIDVSSKKILSVVRNFDEDDQELPEARDNFVKYIFVPGMGFYDIGLLHILGNTTNAITAAWRELLDGGMYACFPGFLMADTGARQNTNIFRIPPGGGALVKTGGMPIAQAIMPLPYNQQGAPALMNLVGDISQTGMRIGGTSEQQVGEGRADAPVGTTLAMIEQATKLMSAVHKRMHSAQAEEFRLLVRTFKEHPDSFWQRNKKPACNWDEQSFLAALERCELTPQADPNTASHTQRLMKIMALKQLQQASPMLYDPLAIDRAAITAIGYSNPDQFLAPPEAQAKPPPELEQAQAKMKVDQQNADSKKLEATSKAQVAQATAQKIQVDTQANPGGLAGKGGKQQQVDTEVDKLNAQAKLMDAQSRQQQADTARGTTLSNAHEKKADRASREKLEMLNIAREVLLHPEAAPIAQGLVGKAEKATGEPAAPEAGGEAASEP
jgi:hypothetical protein